MFKDQFDGFFISAELGAMKPSEDFFGGIVAKLLSAQAIARVDEILFFDDTLTHVAAAKRSGMHASPYKSVNDVVYTVASHVWSK